MNMYYKKIYDEIDDIDLELTGLFEKRMNLWEDSGAFDSSLSGIKKEALYENIMTKLTHWKCNYIQYLDIFRNLREPVEDPKIVYQGEPGAYSEMAALDFFGNDIDPRGLLHFEDTFEALKNNEADYAVLPIENSTSGAIRQVYDLLTQYDCYVVGETTVSVKHNLMALPGTKIEDIDTVYSHEQGLFQCESFLKKHEGWKLHPQADTAGSAKKVAELNNKHAAAICSSRAAEIYNLEILAENINSNTNNTTRFVVVSPKPELREGRDKIGIALTTAHKAGALHEILTIFTIHGLNLVKLESRPIPEHNWEYMFFIEFTGDLTSPGMEKVMNELIQTAFNLRIFGNYKSNLK